MPVLDSEIEQPPSLTEGTEEIPEGGYPPAPLDTPLAGSGYPLSSTIEEEAAAEAATGVEESGSGEVPLVPVMYPGMYGGLPQTFLVPASGRSRPQFGGNLSFGLGYDDNRNQASGREGARPFSSEVSDEEDAGSFLARTSAAFSVAYGTRRTVFSLDLSGSTDYYLDASDNGLDYNLRLSGTVGHQATSRLSLSASTSVAYRSQPDTGRVNAASRTSGDVFDLLLQGNASYRLTRSLSSVTTLGLDTQLYQSSAQEGQSYYDVQFGESLHYQWFQNFSLILDGRYSVQTHPDDSALDSTTLSLLAGAEYRKGRRLSTSLRLGASRREFETGGDPANSPFLEAAGSWRYSRRGAVNLSTRYGFEESQRPGSEATAFRTSLGVTQGIGPRLSATARVNWARRETAGLSDAAGTEDTLGLGLGLSYRLDRHWSARFSYDYTQVSALGTLPGYERNQVFFGVNFAF